MTAIQAEVAYGIIAMIALLALSGIAAQFHRRKKFAYAASTTVLSLIAILAAYEFWSGASFVALGLLHIYSFSMLFTALFAIGLALVNTLSYEHGESYTGTSMLLGFAAVGIFVVPMAYSLLAILLAVELMAVPTVLMVAVSGKHRTEAAVKLFLLGSIAIAVLAFAITLIFPYDTTLALSAFQANPSLSGSYIVALSLVLFIAALGMEAALFPFNLWVPDVYEGAPGNVTALLAGINKKVAFVALMEVLFTVFIISKPTFSPMLQILAIATMFFGNLAAMVQYNVKRLFAYSSISQAGYITIGLAVATQYGIESSIFQMIAHMLMIIGAFAIVLWLEGRNIKSMDDYKGLAYRNGFAGIALTILMLSMAGVPPLMGFAGKFLLFSSAVSSNMLVLALIGILNSFLSIYYYARLMSSIYDRRREHPIAMGRGTFAVVAITLVAIVLIGIYPGPIIAIAQQAAHSLLATAI
jgi:NADH-quinone oxidoreductase subunit N